MTVCAAPDTHAVTDRPQPAPPPQRQSSTWKKGYSHSPARPTDRGRPTGSLVFADLYPAANEAAVPGAVKNANPIQRARMYVYTLPRPPGPRTLLEPGFLGSDGDGFNLDSGSSVAEMGLKNAPRWGSYTDNAGRAMVPLLLFLGCPLRCRSSIKRVGYGLTVRR